MNIDTSVVGITIPQGAAKNIKRGTEMLWQDGGLPTAFQRCEYIESDAASTIDTGVQLTAETRVDFDYKIPLWRAWGFLFSGNAGTSYGLQEHSTVGRNRLYFGTNAEDAGNYYNSAYQARHFIRYNDFGHTFYEDGTLIKTIDTSTFNSSNLSLFGRITNLPAYVQCYSCQAFSEYSKLIRNFVPVYLKTTWNNIPAGTIGLYDLCGSICPLTNTSFYINASTGAFTKGADVV